MSDDDEQAMQEQELMSLVQELRQFEPEEPELATIELPNEEASSEEHMDDSQPMTEDQEVVVLQPVEPSSPSPELKRLQFVAPTLQRAQSLSLERAQWAWECMRSRAPSVIEQLEARAVTAQTLISPYASTALASASGWLRWGDAKVGESRLFGGS
jgi:hypothetical protein